MKKARGKNNKNKERLAPSRRKRDRVFAAINKNWQYNRRDK